MQIKIASEMQLQESQIGYQKTDKEQRTETVGPQRID